MHRLFAVVLMCGCSIDAAPREVSADQPLPADLVSGDLVHAGDLAVVVPEPGQTVGISAHRDDGTTFELVIENPLDGVVAIVAPPTASQDDPLATEGVALAAATECTDGAHALEGFHWATDYAWAFQASTTPAANSAANVATALQVAANAITSSRNRCGLADQVSASNSYTGVTTRAPNIPNSTTTVSCGATDGHNVVGFGVLPATYLAVTCYWYAGDKTAVEADLKISTKHRWFALAVPAGCTSSFGIEQVATHEFGHAFGLGHVAQATHASQTMSPLSYPCTNAHLTLGLGDVKGLRALY